MRTKKNKRNLYNHRYLTRFAKGTLPRREAIRVQAAIEKDDILLQIVEGIKIDLNDPGENIALDRFINNASNRLITSLFKDQSPPPNPGINFLFIPWIKQVSLFLFVLLVSGIVFWVSSNKDLILKKNHFFPIPESKPIVDLSNESAPINNLEQSRSPAQILKPLFHNAIQSSINLFQLTGNEAFVEEAFVISDKSKHILIIIDDSRSIPENLFNESLKRATELKQKLDNYEQSILQEQQKEVPDKIKLDLVYEELKRLKEFNIQLITQIEDYSPLLYTLNNEESETLYERLKQKVTYDQTTLIEYFWGHDKLYIFKIDQDGITCHLVDADDRLNQVITKYRTLIRPEVNTQAQKSEFIKISRSLYQVLLEPALEKNQTTNLIIIPDGQLSAVPFEALLITDPSEEDFEHLPYAINEFRISYGLSGNDLLLNTTNKSPVNKKEVKKVYAGFIPQRKSLPCLKSSPQEVKAMANLFGGESFLGENATKKAFKKELNNYQIIHLSTHGMIDNDIPNDSYLVFDEEKNEEKNQYLSLEELYSMKLESNLVVLSACESNMGRIAKGEGVLSLARAFSYAGSRSVVTSLWDPDETTSDNLLTNFYKKIQEGSGKGEALRQAKLAFLNNGEKTTGNPYYWAGYILIGDEKPINIRKPVLPTISKEIHN